MVLIPNISNANELEIFGENSNQQEIELQNSSEKARILINNDGSITINENYNFERIDTTDVKLDMLVVNVDKNINEINVEHNITDEYIEAVITDKKTGEFLESYKEIFESDVNKERSNNIIYRTLEKNYSVKPAIVKTTCRAEIWSSGSFRQINKKPTNVNSVPGNSGRYVLQDKDSYITTTKYPATSVSCNISGNVVITTTSSTTGEFSIEALKGLGFSVSNSTGSTYHARKWYNTTISFSLY